MPLTLENVVYFTAAEVIEDLGITRQTFWRWRKEGKVPAGHRFRDGHVLFTSSELRLVRVYAHRLEPVDASGWDQLKLFNGAL